MDGTRSAIEIRPQKLSKPRTKTSKDLLKVAERVIPTPGTYVFGDGIIVANSESGDRRSRRTTRSKIREFLHGAVQRKSHSDSTVEVYEGGGVQGDIVTGRKVRLSEIGIGSSIEQLASRVASSSHLSNFANSKLLLPYESLSSSQLPSCSNSKLLLSYEAMMPESARIAMEIMGKAHSDSIAAQNHVPPPLEEDMHVDSVLSPIRRRSLYTPGIATRTPDDILRKLPPPNPVLSQADRDYYYNPNLSESSPLGRLAALEIGNCGRSTPTSLEYSHLGGLKPGTLRVMNGTTSPTPSDVNPLRMHPPTPKLVDHDKSSMVSEGVKSNNEFQYSYGDHPILENSQDTSTSQARSGQTNDEDFDSKLIAQASGEDFKDEHLSDDDLGSEGKIGDASNTSTDRKSWSYGKVSTTKSPNQAQCIAEYYMQELPQSPFTYAESSRYSSFNMEHSSPEDEANDDSFEDEGIVISKSPRPLMDFCRPSIDDTDARTVSDGNREDAIRRLTANAASQPDTITRTGSSSTASTKTDLTSKNKKSFASNAANQSDSGYSSSDSLKSFVNSAFGDSKGCPNSGNTTTSLRIISQCGPGSRETPHSALHSTTSDVVRLTATQQSTFAPSSVIAIAEMEEHPSVFNKESIKDSTATLRSSSNTSPRRLATVRKLQKPRPLSQPVPAHLLFVQGIRNLSQSSIPPVPSEIVTRHTERLREFPLLEHTFPTPQHVNTNDSLPTDGLVALPVRFPSPANALSRGNSVIRSNLDWPSPKNRKSKSVLQGSSASNSKAQRRKSLSEASSAIVSFGTEILGDSPYSIARSAMGPRNKNIGNALHSNQKNNPTSRPKSMIAMEEGFAAESAGTRSRQGSPSFSRIHLPSPASFNDGSRICGKLGRPRSMYAGAAPLSALPNQEGIDISPSSLSKTRDSFDAVDSSVGYSGNRMFVDVPPVPVLPTKHQVAQWEARISTCSSAKPTILPPPLQIRKPTENPKTPMQARNVVLANYENNGDSFGDWKSYQEVGGQRRRSAGDALLLRFQALRNSKPSPLAERSLNHSKLKKYIPYKPPSFPSIQNQADASYNMRPSLQPVSSPQTLKKESTLSLQTPNASENQISTAAVEIENFTGRYTGGLSYCYEPGLGLGGSDGTRTHRTNASRKSVDMSRGYGVDMSDVPIFVALSQ